MKQWTVHRSSGIAQFKWSPLPPDYIVKITQHVREKETQRCALHTQIHGLVSDQNNLLVEGFLGYVAIVRSYLTSLMIW